MTIWYLPLEHIENRYTVHMDRDIQKYLRSHDYDFEVVQPLTNVSPPPPEGHFLNSAFTIGFKSDQIVRMADAFSKGEIKDSDVIWVADLWFPGIEGLFYMKHFYNSKVKIKGFVHAGSFTPGDHIQKIEKWARPFEEMVFNEVDEIFVGSQDCKNELLSKRNIRTKITVTGLPLDSQLDNYRSEEKENIVVFNGRLSPEKRPDAFLRLKDDLRYSGYEFVNCFQQNFSKEEYYRLLGRSKVVVSYALEETFGFGVNEAVHLGCLPVVPDSLCYKEFYPEYFRYPSDEVRRATPLVKALMEDYDKIPKLEAPGADFSEGFKTWFR